MKKEKELSFEKALAIVQLLTIIISVYVGIDFSVSGQLHYQRITGLSFQTCLWVILGVVGLRTYILKLKFKPSSKLFWQAMLVISILMIGVPAIYLL